MKKTGIVDVVRGKSQGVRQCYQTRDQGGWEFVTTSKNLALQVSKVGLFC